MRRLAVLAGAVALLVGCSTVDQMQRDVQGTQIRVENTSYDQAWQAMLTAVEKHLMIKDADKETGIIQAYVPLLGSLGGDWAKYPWEEAVTVFITPTESNTIAYNFDVASVGYFHRQQPATDWEPLLLKEIAANLAAK